MGNKMKLIKTAIVAAATGLLLTTAHAQTWITNGLVAYYPFNGNANDASGHGLNANVQGTYQYLSDGTLHLIGDNSLFYSGGGYVALPNYGNLNSGFTISIWVGNETDHGNSIMAEYYVWFDNNNSQNVAIGQHDSYMQDGLASADFPLTIANFAPWKQLLLVYSPGKCAAYLNGTNIGSTNATVSPFPMINSAIGRHWWAGGANSSARMTMDIKNFRIYNRALSSNEVAQLYFLESPTSISIQKAVYLTSSTLKTSTNYQLQVSSDLLSWTNYGSVFTATNSSWRTTNYWDVANWSQLFFRLQQQ
jgi:hypothetical protein